MKLRFAALLCALLIAPASAQDSPTAATAPEVTPAAPLRAQDGSTEPPVETAEPAAPADDSAAPEQPGDALPAAPDGAAGQAGSGEEVLAVEAPAEALQDEGSADAPAVDAEPPVPTVDVRRVVVLQPEFRVFVQSAGGTREIEPGWTEQAQNALALAVERHLRHDGRFALAAPAEPATAEEASLLREHVELFKVVANNSSMMIRFGGKAWQEKKLQYDYTLGDGLAAYGQLSNADYAFMIGGAQVKQTGGSVFMQLALAGTLGVVMPGGGTYLVLALVDMRTGDIVWFNSLEGGEVFGMTGSDLRSEGTADEVVGKLLDPFPATALFNTKIF